MNALLAFEREYREARNRVVGAWGAELRAWLAGKPGALPVPDVKPEESGEIPEDAAPVWPGEGPKKEKCSVCGGGGRTISGHGEDGEGWSGYSGPCRSCGGKGWKKRSHKRQKPILVPVEPKREETIEELRARLANDLGMAG